MLSPGPGLPTISKKLFDAIRAGNYVDFAQFPAAKGRSIPPTSLEGQSLGAGADTKAGARLCYMDPELCHICSRNHCTLTRTSSRADGLHAQHCKGKH